MKTIDRELQSHSTSTTTVSTAIALIAKAPVAGQVKTRFCPPCTPEQAALLAKAFLDDTAELVTSERIVSRSDPWCAYLDGAEVLRAILPPAISLFPQQGAGFDERLANAAEELFAAGYQRVVLLAADCPTVTDRYLDTALNGLETHDCVLGPANDGGYVLIGLTRPDRRLFAGIEMGTDQVLRQTLKRIDSVDMTVELLPALHDLDTIDELHLALQAGQLAHARHTLALLRQAQLQQTQLQQTQLQTESTTKS